MSICKEFWSFCIEKRISQHAKALSFSTLLSILPLLSIFLGSFASSSWMLMAKEKLQSLFMQYLVPKPIQGLFVDYINIMIANASHIKTMGFILFLISILFLFLDIENSFHDLANTEIKASLHWRMFSIVALFFTPILFFALLGLAEWIFSQTPDLLQHLVHSLLNYPLLINVMLAILLWGWFAFLYTVIPNKHANVRYSLVAAGITTMLFMVSQKLFSLYLSAFSNFDLVYGIFSIIPIFILWIYINWQIVLYGFAIMLFSERFRRM